MKNIYRHGDINLHEVEKMEGKTVKHTGTLILGLGETTGHSHRLTVSNAKDLTIKKDSEGNYYFELKSEGTLSHEEHKTLKIKPGIYKRIQEREVDHFQGSIVRKVID
jgi:hypothetical protein